MENAMENAWKKQQKMHEKKQQKIREKNSEKCMKRGCWTGADSNEFHGVNQLKFNMFYKWKMYGKCNGKCMKKNNKKCMKKQQIIHEKGY